MSSNKKFLINNLLGGRWGEESCAGGSLFRRGSGRRETEDLLNVLSNGHRAENVEEDKGTISHVSAGQVPMGNALKKEIERGWNAFIEKSSNLCLKTYHRKQDLAITRKSPYNYYSEYVWIRAFQANHTDLINVPYT